ncbi:large-conductance mechanosensitive channel protein MscL [Rhodococcus oryzae]|uniref:large-conductance mechanosensitive channel protein MscL n=1 Tax=Rhodococcus oryzae TaxID=2571143 RepID=UPI00371E0CCA
MLKGFKEFLLRGNVLDLAVAVVVGAAFTAIVTSFTENIVNPLVASLGGSNEMGFGFQITDSPETFVNLGAVLSAVINFVLIAAVVYFVLIVPFNSVKERFMTEEEKEATDIELLTEIRNLLADANADTNSTRVES